MNSPSPSIPPDLAAFDRDVAPAFVAAKFGISLDELQRLFRNRPWPRLTCRIVQGAERDGIIRQVLERIDTADLRVVGDNDGTVWERGWGEIFDRIRAQGFDSSLLYPQYFDQHRIMRFDGHYIDAGSSAFVKSYDDLLRRVVLARYLGGATRVVELGCGTGTSQSILTELLPDAELVAADWAAPSQDIIRILAAHMKRAIRPVRFNMLTLEGFDELAIDQATSVLSVHALEQLGGNWGPLLDKLLEVKPQLCVHLEPIVELYDEGTLFDFLAVKYHRRRNYLHGWLTRLRELAAEGKVEIIDERRLGFGDRYHEAYSVLAWRPL
jgi:hypothetical protein